GETDTCFIPTTPASPFPQEEVSDCSPWMPLDCRHGRLLLHNEDGDSFTVWDPITGAREEVHVYEPCTSLASYSAAVLCGAAGCDHRDCRSSPYLVVWVWMVGAAGLAHARVYSSQVGSWGATVSVRANDSLFVNSSRGALVGNHVYFMLEMGARILKYDLVKHHLSVIKPPESYNNISIMPTEDGLLGIAGIRDSSLALWSRKANVEEGVEGWTKYRVIELQTLLPVDSLLETAIVVAFAESARVIFICTDDGHFIIDLSSEQARKVSELGMQYPIPIVPFMSFYTPDCACGKFPLPSETN
ncbi:unnamed protein product, partial [Urochloa humidicola]